MSVSLAPQIRFRWFDNNGNPLAGGLVYTYVSGSTIPAPTWTDTSGAIQNTNPVVLDSAGYASIYLLDTQVYRFVVKNASGVIQQTVDGVTSSVPATSQATVTPENITATQGQTVFVFSTPYGVGTGNLQVFINGALQSVDVDYTETDANTITFVTGLNAGDVVQGRFTSLLDVGQTSASLVSYEGGTNVQNALDLLNDRKMTAVTDFGAVGDGITDDAPAIQLALDTGNSVFFPAGTYLIKSMLNVSTIRQKIYGNATIKFAADFDSSVNGLVAFSVNASYVDFDGLTFDGSASVHSTYRDIFIYAAFPLCSVTNCKFLNLATGATTATQAAISAGGLGVYLNVSECYFNNCPGCVFTQGRNSTISNNRMINSTDAAIALNGTSCAGSIVIGNTISNEALAQIPSMIAVEEGASEWIIDSNILKGVTGGGIFCTNVAVITDVFGGKINNNIIDGSSGTVTNPATMLYVSVHYLNTTVTNNTIRNCPTGNANTRMMIVGSTGSIVSTNIIDGSNASGLGAITEVRAGAGGIIWRDNVITGYAGARLVLLQAGNYTGLPVHFVGGKYLVGATGIDAELNIGSITGLLLYIENILQSSMTSALVSAITQLGARSTWLNSGGWAKPHSIKVLTEMYGTVSPPTAPAAGNQAWVAGDKINYLSPVFPGYTGAQLVSTTWRNFGAFV